jgi:hypothetical protein
MDTNEMRQAMSTLKAFSDKDRAYHAYQARQNYLREQRGIQRHLEELKTETEQQRAALEQARAAKEQAQAEKEQERPRRNRNGPRRNRNGPRRNRNGPRKNRRWPRKKRLWPKSRTSKRNCTVKAAPTDEGMRIRGHVPINFQGHID